MFVTYSISEITYIVTFITRIVTTITIYVSEKNVMFCLILPIFSGFLTLEGKKTKMFFCRVI